MIAHLDNKYENDNNDDDKNYKTSDGNKNNSHEGNFKTLFSFEFCL